MKIISDAQLISQYLKGDEASFKLSVERYLPLIYGYVRNYTGDAENASDIAQDVFVKVWKNIKRYDSKRSFRTWIFTIAKRTAIDWLKQKKALPFSMIESEDGENAFVENLADQSPSIVEQFSRAMTRRELAFALEQLPSKYSRVIALHGQKELTFREIASAINEPLNTVKSRYRRGLAMLKTILSGNN